MDAENRHPNEAPLPPPPPKKPPSLPYSRPSSKITKKIDFSPLSVSALRTGENEGRRESRREEEVVVKGWRPDPNSPKKLNTPPTMVPPPPVLMDDKSHRKGDIEPIELKLTDLPAFLSSYFSKIAPEFQESTISNADLIMNLAKTEDLHFLRYNLENPPNSKVFALPQSQKLEAQNSKVTPTLPQSQAQNSKVATVPQSLAILHSDRGCLSFKRLNLVHLSVEDDNEAELESFMSKLLDYIWKNDNCEEVRCHLLHREKEDGELKEEEMMKKAFSKTGWRWKSLTNDKYTGSRSTVYGIRRNGEKYPAPSDL